MQVHTSLYHLREEIIPGYICKLRTGEDGTDDHLVIGADIRVLVLQCHKRYDADSGQETGRMKTIFREEFSDGGYSGWIQGTE